MVALSFVLSAGCDGPPRSLDVEPQLMLAGEWQFLTVSGKVAMEFTFDGETEFTFATFDNAGRSIVRFEGSYRADGRTIELDGVDADSGQRVYETMNYFANHELFSLNAMVPDGGTEGVYGSWIASSFSQTFDADGNLIDDFELDSVLELRPDKTGTLVQARPITGDSVFEGELLVLGSNAFVFAFESRIPPFTRYVEFALLDGVALSGVTLFRP